MKQQQTAPLWETLKKGFREYLACGLSRPQDSPKRKQFFLCLHLFFAIFFTVCVVLYLRIGLIVIVYRLDGFLLWELVACVSVMALLEWIPAIGLLRERRERRRREKKWWL